MSVVRIKLPDHPHSLLVEAVKQVGFIESYGDYPHVIEWKDKKSFEKSNDFCIINRVKSLDIIGSYPSFCRLMQKLSTNFPKIYNFIPKTYVLPFDSHKLLKKMKTGGSNYVYRSDSSPHKRIAVINPSDFLVSNGELAIGQEIINNYLIDQKRFSVTAYALVISLSPIRIYVFNEGLYTMEDSYFVKTEDELKEKKPRLLSELLPRIEKESGVTAETFWRSISQKIILSVIACAKYMNMSASDQKPYPKNFQILSFDFVVGFGLKPYVVSIETSFDMNYSSAAERRLKENIIMDALRLVVPITEMQQICSTRKYWFDNFSYKQYVQKHPNLPNIINEQRMLIEKKVNFICVFPTEDKIHELYDAIISAVKKMPFEIMPGM